MRCYWGGSAQESRSGWVVVAVWFRKSFRNASGNGLVVLRCSREKGGGGLDGDVAESVTVEVGIVWAYAGILKTGGERSDLIRV